MRRGGRKPVGLLACHSVAKIPFTRERWATFMGTGGIVCVFYWEECELMAIRKGNEPSGWN